MRSLRSRHDHRHVRLASLLLALTVLQATATAAQTISLDRDACRRRALAAAPEMRSAAGDVTAGGLNLDIANAGFLPTLHGEGAYLRSSTDRHGVPDFAANNGADEYVARGVLSQPLYAGGALAAARRKAQAEQGAATYALVATRSQVVLAADEAFYAVLTATERGTIAESAQAVSAELLRAARVRLGNGEIPALDVGRLELEVAQATTVVDSAHTQLAIARNELATLIGVPDSDLEVRPLQDEDGARPESLDDLVASAAASRPEVKRLDLEVQALESAVGLAHGARLPQLRAEAAAGWDSLTLPDGQNAGWQAGVTLSVPLWDWKILERREHLALIEVDQARQQLAALRRAITLEVTRRYLEADLAGRLLTTAVQAERLARRNAESARQGYGLGLVSNLELITAERQATAAASDRSATRFAQLLAESRLDFAAGRLE